MRSNSHVLTSSSRRATNIGATRAVSSKPCLRAQAARLVGRDAAAIGARQHHSTGAIADFFAPLALLLILAKWSLRRRHV